MSKQLRTLLIAGVSIVALGGLLAVLLLLPEQTGASSSSEASSTASSDPSITLTDKSKDAEGQTVEQPVKKIEATVGDSTFVIEPNADKQMAVTKYQNLPIHSTRIDSLCSDLASLTASKEIGTPEDLAAYGLAEPKASMTVTYHDDTVYTMELGDETPLKDGYYLRDKEKGTVYVVDTYVGEELLQKDTMYIGTSLITSPTVDSEKGGTAGVRDMELSGTVRAGRPLALRMVTTEDNLVDMYASYVLTKPYFKGVDSTAMETLTSGMLTLTANKAVVPFPTKEQKTEYGFDNPYSVAKLHLAVSTTVKEDPEDEESADKTSYYDVREHTVILGKKDEDGNYYAMIDDYDVIYLVSPSSVPWAETTYNDIATTMLFSKMITDVKSVTVTVNGKQTVFELTHYPDAEERDDQMVVTVDGKQYSTPNFRSLYQVFMMIQRNGDSSGEVSGEPELSIQLTPIDDKQETITAKLYKFDASEYTCVLGDGDVYSVKASSVDRTIKQIENYLAGKDVSTN